MTRKLRALGLALALCAPLLLTGCPSPRAVHETPPANAVEAAQHAIDELNVAIAATASALDEAYKKGSVTWAQFSDARDELNTARSLRDQARELQKAGELILAANKAEGARALANLVEKRLIAIKAKQSFNPFDVPVYL